ncbi:hypothetical protein BOX15_Mlig011273g1 [Macrostomum lignano]|uniref:Exonuclease domain-containing protein n=1 Tax=Macrostomum lignano TaxID=282301 RepID=A0A267FS87_9PLAT|nr:hypothetical protein BOX15_Mlig011273g1 [Macrostomum lignano]
MSSSADNDSAEERELRQLRVAASDAGLDCRGNAEILSRRIRSYKQARVEQAYRYLLVVDFEATCESQNPDNYQHEIIEFPLVLLDLHEGKVVDKFHTYCRPKLHPKLSEFCRQFTGIEQDVVDSAPSFPAALAAVQAWLQHSDALTEPLALAADCQADVATFLRLQCSLDGIPVPAWAHYWVNLRITFQRHYALERKLNLSGMLAALGLEFEGRPHCGLDDAVNVAKIALQLAADGCRLLVNQRLDQNKSPYYWRPVYKAEAEAKLRSDAAAGGTTTSRQRGRRGRRHASPEAAAAEARLDDICDDETEESLSDLLYLVNLRNKCGGAGGSSTR